MPEDTAQRTEPATPRKREEVRKKGQVAKSVEINSALVLLAGIISLKFFGAHLFTQLSQMMHYIFSNFYIMEITESGITFYFYTVIIRLSYVLVPIIGLIVLVALISNFFQVGFSLSLQPISPTLDKINPITGFSRIFSTRSSVELVKSIFKIIIVGYIAYAIIKANFHNFVPMMDMDIRQSINFIAFLAYKIAIYIAIALVIMAVFDYGYQRFEFEKSIRMTKQEIKDEYKQLEGDPLLRSRIRQRQREIARRRMMQEVPKADVIITNPLHLAVAIKYDENTMTAPLVIAKGARLIAEKIKEIAASNNIPMVENPPLAQVLYKLVEIGQEVPPHLYQVVAEILAFVYKLKGGKKKVG